MPAIHFKAATLGGLEVVQLSPVNLLRDNLAIHLPADLELKYESFHSRHHVTDVDSGPVDVLALLRLYVCSGVGVGSFGVDRGEGRTEGRFAEDGVGLTHHVNVCFIE